MGDRILEEGAGWRLGWNPAATCYCGLLGGQGWAIELTAAEFQGFCRLALELRDTLEAVATELMDEERITCDVETDQIWLEAEGFPNAYRLRFILSSGRRGEGEWGVAATQALTLAIQQTIQPLTLV